MRHALDPGQFTPVGIFLQEYCRTTCLSVSNIDYYIEDFTDRTQLKIQLLEEKQNGALMGDSQRLCYRNLHRHLMVACPVLHTEYWGVFVLQLARGTTIPGPGMLLNGQPITLEQFVKHINFETKFCEGMFR